MGPTAPTTPRTAAAPVSTLYPPPKKPCCYPTLPPIWTRSCKEIRYVSKSNALVDRELLP